MENSNTKNSNTELKYQLTFDLGKRHEAHIENLGTFFSRQNGDTIENAHPYFEEEYKMTLAIIDYIVSHQAQNSHNTILISGSRGAGKTSFLHTIRAGLEKRNCNQDYGNNAPVNNNSFGNSAINNTSFYCLPEIDPSYFDENRNILKTVITLMFKQAKNRYMKKTGDCSDADFTELWKQFENVNKTLKCVDGKQTESYTLEGLNEYSDAADLREQMEHLVSAFLKICGDSNGFLVLLIDDLDMNVSYAAEMMEQIRKFLMIKKLIILISANLEQLQSEMREYYSKSFVTAKNTGLTIDIDDLATKYLLKMFPPKRRIFLDDAKQHLIETRLIIKGTSSSEATFENYNGENNQGLSLQKVLLSLLWDRTRLLFIPKKNQLHPLIPSNMRELFQFIAVLADMEPTDEPKDGKLFSNERDYEKIRRNIITFKNYIINIWVPTHLSEDERRLIHNMPKDIEEVNKYLVQAINKVGNKYKHNDHYDNSNYTMVVSDDSFFTIANRISYITNFPSNVSYGDLLLLIHRYETYFTDSHERNFIYAIKILYTILLFETTILILQEENHTYPIQTLIGGTLYQPRYFILTQIWDWELLKIIDSQFPDNDHNYPHYHMLEQNEIKNPYFVLYYGKQRPNRQYPTHPYDTKKTFSSSDGRFDLLAPMINILNPMQVNKRYSGDCEFLENSPETLWINKHCKFSDTKNTQYTNTLLPIFSVDLMLEYLASNQYYNDIVIHNDFNREMETRVQKFAQKASEYSSIGHFPTTQQILINLEKNIETNDIELQIQTRELTRLYEERNSLTSQSLEIDFKIKEIKEYIEITRNEVNELSAQIEKRKNSNVVDFNSLNSTLENLEKTRTDKKLELKNKYEQQDRISTDRQNLYADIRNNHKLLDMTSNTIQKLKEKKVALANEKERRTTGDKSQLENEYINIEKNICEHFTNLENLKNYYEKVLWETVTIRAFEQIEINTTIRETYRNIFETGKDVVFQEKYAGGDGPKTEAVQKTEVNTK